MNECRDGRGQRMSAIGLLSLALASLLFCSCAGDDIFQPIGDNISAPLEMSIDSTTGRLYLVNSNNTVLYKDASMQVYDITSPEEPSLVGTAVTLNFSGHTYYDATLKQVFLTNRYSDQGNSDLIDNIIRVNVDESSADFLEVRNFPDGSNPFGMDYDASSDRLYAAAYNSTVEYFSPDDPSDITAVSVADLNLSDGSTLDSTDMRDIAVIGDQAFITIPNGGIFVYDLVENNVDYYVSDFLSPRAIISDGTYAIMSDVEEGDDLLPLVYVIDPAAFPRLADNNTVIVKSKEDAGVIVHEISVSDNADADPEELALSSRYVFVTNTNDNSVVLIKRSDFTIKKTILVGEQPFGMGVYSPGGADAYLYVANISDNTLSIIDLTSLSVVATYP